MVKFLGVVMSKNKPSQSLINNLTSPALLYTAIYFTVYLESKKEYLELSNQITHKVKEIRKALMETKVIPKYFDVLVLDKLEDLKLLVAELTLEINGDKAQVINTVENKEEKDNIITMDYANFLTEKIKAKDLPLLNTLITEKLYNKLPEVITTYNDPKLINDAFMMDLNGKLDFKIVDLDYEFPQKCTFAIPFLILGNQGPIEKFENKLYVGIELPEKMEVEIQKIFNNSSIVLHDYDLLENASIYDLDLKQNKLIKEIEKTIENNIDNILYYNDYPVFVQINKDKQLNIRLPFLTFDMFAQNGMINEEDMIDIELSYANFNNTRLMVAGILSDLGLDYSYIIGKKVDFHHEPEMKKSVLSKVMARDIINGNIFFEESDHHIVKDEKSATIVNLSCVQSNFYDIFIITKQNKKEILRQINVYLLEQDFEDEESLSQIADFFLEVNPELEHVRVDHIYDLSYCEHHLKLNGLVLNNY